MVETIETLGGTNSPGAPVRAITRYKSVAPPPLMNAWTHMETKAAKTFYNSTSLTVPMQ